MSDVFLAASFLWVIKNVTFGLGEHVTTGLLCECHVQGDPESAIQDLPHWQLDMEWGTVSGQHGILMASVPWSHVAGAGCSVCRNALAPHPGLGGEEAKVLDYQEGPLLSLS